MAFIIGRKIEMTQLFKDDGTVVPVTLVKAEPNVVTQVRTEEKDGYTAVQFGTESSKKLNKPESGHVKDLEPVRTLREIRVDSTEHTRGDKIDVNVFEPGTKVDVVGYSKGRGFTGVMKRHNFKGGQATHGNKDQQRMPGSVASRPQGKVIKGQRMAGRMGTDRVTVKNLEVVSVDIQKNTIAIKGAIPGARGGLIMITARDGKTIWQQ
ncbi:50S ribosomal protein L3 [Candidatus Uhrbacteria bacterium CG_4_9_14_3_um_filter_50_9]|uniref:Large ribosomal subunit protein uL3 n=1 Tax=Candidatus Uhrbacteria bacterium CG_4_9_14_3_um_filter_50_9 TaxID=1975035 RepID=A0A2M7XBJ2_9BACT|nr:MAG: 50S ribosomal protein L3 [Candidatus Uhrbacteria bacterium CG_4_9_14_3_um_filter_50_9]